MYIQGGEEGVCKEGGSELIFPICKVGICYYIFRFFLGEMRLTPLGHYNYHAKMVGKFHYREAYEDSRSDAF